MKILSQTENELVIFDDNRSAIIYYSCLTLLFFLFTFLNFSSDQWKYALIIGMILTIGSIALVITVPSIKVTMDKIKGKIFIENKNIIRKQYQEYNLADTASIEFYGPWRAPVLFFGRVGISNSFQTNLLLKNGTAVPLERYKARAKFRLFWQADPEIRINPHKISEFLGIPYVEVSSRHGNKSQSPFS